MDNLQNVIYKDILFELKTITGDENCLFRASIFGLYIIEHQLKNLYDIVYQYLSNNIYNFYEFYSARNDIYYIE